MPAGVFPLGSRHGIVPGRWLTAGSLEVTANSSHYLGSVGAFRVHVPQAPVPIVTASR